MATPTGFYTSGYNAAITNGVRTIVDHLRSHFTRISNTMPGDYEIHTELKAERITVQITPNSVYGKMILQEAYNLVTKEELEAAEAAEKKKGSEEKF